MWCMYLLIVGVCDMQTNLLYGNYSGLENGIFFHRVQLTHLHKHGCRIFLVDVVWGGVGGICGIIHRDRDHTGLLVFIFDSHKNIHSMSYYYNVYGLCWPKEQLCLPTVVLFNSSSINAWIKSLHIVSFVMPDTKRGLPHIQIGISFSTYG